MAIFMLASNQTTILLCPGLGLTMNNVVGFNVFGQMTCHIEIYTIYV
uniref:Uncharacterized protein n=1 Tax=Rhizophora mucronata TaxID=61149 RepID=A0A2P2P6E9_RHIMU